MKYEPKDLPNMSGRCCGNCKHFVYGGELTHHDPPRFPQGAGGACSWPMPVFALPESVSISLRTAHQEDRRISTALHPFHSYMRVKDGGMCPTWEAREITEAAG